VKIPAMADEPDAIRIEPMLASDASAVRRIHLDGIATGVATLERDAPDWISSTAPITRPAGSSRGGSPMTRSSAGWR
jgi:L-amino acid N-acyltransferase YncA